MEVPVSVYIQNLHPSLYPSNWNSTIKHHAKLRNDRAIISTYTQMEAMGILPDSTTLPLVLKACGRLKAVERGKKIHKDVSTWKDLIGDMREESFEANSVTVVALLLACGELLDLRTGKEVHGYCLRNGLLYLDPHVGTALLGFYLRFDVRIACAVFETMGLRNAVSWNAMITGYLDVGKCKKALELFSQMLIDGIRCDNVTILLVIQACAEFGSPKLGMQVHQMAIKLDFCKDLYIVNSLDAMSLFAEMRFEGIKADERTIAIISRVCEDLPNGLLNCRSLHGYGIKSGLERNKHLGNALLSVYAAQSCVKDAKTVFHEIGDADVISWNTLILALAHSYESKGQACEIFGKMRESDTKPNSHTIISVLAACEAEAFLNIGRSFHGYVIKHNLEIDPSLNSALTEMYMNCGDEATGRNLFERYGDKDLISWNSLISNYIRNNKGREALLFFQQMISEMEPNPVTVINVLSSCTHLANLPQGLCLHAYTVRREFSMGFELSLANSLITMYARCGNMQYAEKIFKTLSRKNIVSWNAMISGYGMHGRGHDAMLAFSQMLEDGFKPNSITFISALSACSHCGLIEKGLQLFTSMVQEFYITPDLIHYACVADLLSRGGSLGEAMKFVELMPIAPDASVWRALLGGCRVYSETKLARRISEKLLELEPTNPGNYILLSNIYAAAGLWSEVNKLRAVLEEKGLKKPPGKSWIVMRGDIHCFKAGDKSHAQSDAIYAKLSSLMSSVKEGGYIPDLRWVLHDEEDEEKMKRLFSHSEKLAIAYGLINVSSGAPISITKNLRICGDCHEFSKHVSKLVQREIVLRDGSRFHRFVNGVCSCKDYW
ncbi:hypothetical protein RJ640_022346 [Escallonia rubra]|uniref:DYW domain-containing protein n=1 Tax=Escallonia rubra TaxID=112253 RepID=A0AA88QBS9_9ASTE|nr:hypothetical protein RJ640_022346 [Escallonia rubra]